METVNSAITIAAAVEDAIIIIVMSTYILTPT